MCLLAISQNKIQLQNESLPLPKAFKRKVLQTLKATKNKIEREGRREGGGKGREGKEEIKSVHPSSCKGNLSRTSTWVSNVTTVKRDHLLNFKICLKWSPPKNLNVRYNLLHFILLFFLPVGNSLSQSKQGNILTI